MDLGSIFLILALALLVGLFVARPLLERKSTSVSKEEHEYSGLLAERDRILNALQELDFDFTLGKIPEADYPAQREFLLQRGAAVLKQLDAFQTMVPEDAVEARLEAAISARRADAARRGQLAPNGASNRPVSHRADDSLEVLIANRRRERKEKAAGFCPQCGRPVQKSDRFCPRCGRTLAP
jgi:hypothetical protein